MLSLSLSLATVSCGFFQEPDPASAAARANPPRDHLDDRDPAALIPLGVETVIDVDMAILRASPWTASALGEPDVRVKVHKDAALGYDDVTDVDRILYAVTTAGAAAPTLVVAQGRFQPARLDDSFRTRWPNAVAETWRGVTLLVSGENSFASLTARTFVSGAPAAVRAVIDLGFGVGTDFSGDAALGPVRRALLSEGTTARPAIVATLAISDRMRARVGDTFPLPPELRQVGLRLDLGKSFELQVLGFLDDPAAATQLGRRLEALLLNRATRLGLAAVGLGDVVSGAHLALDGARVRAFTSVGEEHAGALAATLRSLAGALRGGTDPTGLRSW